MKLTIINKGEIVRSEKRCFICGARIPESPYKNDECNGSVNVTITYIWHDICLKCQKGE